MNDILGIPETFHFIRNVRGRTADDEICMILYLLDEFSLRISEVLRITPDNIVEKKFIFIKISKSNHYIEINNSFIANQLLEFFNKLPLRAFSVNYQDVYRYINKNRKDLIIRSKGKNRKITHSFRYIKASKMKYLSDYHKKLQASLHHKSIKSQEYYKLDK